MIKSIFFFLVIPLSLLIAFNYAKDFRCIDKNGRISYPKNGCPSQTKTKLKPPKIIAASHTKNYKCIDEYGKITYSKNGCPSFTKPPKKYVNSAYKCVKKNGVTEFSDKLCQGTTSEEIEIIEYNNTQGLSYNERVRVHNYDTKIQNNKAKYRANNSYANNDSTNTASTVKCQQHTNAKDRVQTKLRNGYSAGQYNYLHERLRYQKDMMRKYCL